MTALEIPDLEPDTDTLDAALAYASNGGWYVLPVKRGTKHPGSVVGEHWQDKSSRDVKQITAWFAGTDHGIALHCGRSGAVVFDVDDPGKLPDVLRAHLPAAPYQSTRPGTAGRGHYLFRMPPGRNLGNSTGLLAKGWGEIRGLNGVIIVQPSHHKDDGGRYQWERTGVVPALPAELAEQLPDASPAADAATDAAVTAFITEHRASSRPNLLQALVYGLRKRYDAGESRHQATVTTMAGALKEAVAGFYSAREAIDAIWPLFLTAVTAPPQSDKQGAARSTAEAGSEFAGILAWAVGQARAANPQETVMRVNDKMPEDDLFDGDPIPLTQTTPIPAFPVDALPGPIAEMVYAVSEATQTDPAMPAVSALSALSACTGGHAEIEIRGGWREPAHLYTATIAAPGERKSAVQLAMARPILDAEQQLVTVGMGERLEAETRKQVATAAAERAKREAAAAEKDTWDVAMANAIGAAQIAESIEVPAAPRLIADDITPESVASVLAQQGGRLAIISAEGGIFDIIAGRYSHNVPNLDVWLKSHSGDPLKVDRQGRAPEYIRRPALTLGLMIQPEVLNTIAANRQFRGRGLLARILYAYPTPKVGYRTIAPNPPEPTTVAGYEAVMRGLATGMAKWVGDPAVLILTPTAQKAMLAIEEAVEPTLAGEGELAQLADWGAKYAGAIARIAGILHLAEQGPEVGPKAAITAQTIESAWRIGKYFKACAINAFTEMGTDYVTADAVYLLGRIASLGVDEVSERDLHAASSRARFKTKADLMPALDRLVDCGYVAPIPPERSGQRGRPASPRYQIHPLATATVITKYTQT
jgi:hypothetical protein